MNQKTLSRRSLLSGMAALPILASFGAVTAPAASAATVSDISIGSLPGRPNLNSGGATFTTSSGARLLTLPDGMGAKAHLIDLSSLRTVATTDTIPGESRKEAAAMTWNGGGMIMSVDGRAYVAEANRIRVFPAVRGRSPYGQMGGSSTLLTKPRPGALASGLVGDFQGNLGLFDVPATGTSNLWRAFARPFGSSLITALGQSRGWILVGVKDSATSTGMTGLWRIQESKLVSAIAAGTLNSSMFTRVTLSGAVDRILQVLPHIALGTGAVAVRRNGSDWDHIDPTTGRILGSMKYSQSMATSTDGSSLYGRWNHWGTYYLAAIAPTYTSGPLKFVASLGPGQIEPGLTPVQVDGQEMIVGFHPSGAVVAPITTPVDWGKASSLPAHRDIDEKIVTGAATLIGLVACDRSLRHTVMTPQWVNDDRVAVVTMATGFGYGGIGAVGQQVYSQNTVDDGNTGSTQVELLHPLHNGLMVMGTYPDAGVRLMNPATGDHSPRLMLSGPSSNLTIEGDPNTRSSRPVCAVQLSSSRVIVGTTGKYATGTGGAIAVVNISSGTSARPTAVHHSLETLGLTGHNVVSLEMTSVDSQRYLLVGTSTVLEQAGATQIDDAVVLSIPISTAGVLGKPRKISMPKGAKAVWALHRSTRTGRIFALVQYGASNPVLHEGKAVGGVNSIIELDKRSHAPTGHTPAGNTSGTGLALYPTVQDNSRFRRYGQLVEAPDGTLISRSNVFLRRITVDEKGPVTATTLPGINGAGELTSPHIHMLTYRMLHVQPDGNVYARGV